MKHEYNKFETLCKISEKAAEGINQDILEILRLLDTPSFQKYVRRQAIKTYLHKETLHSCCKLLAKLVFNFGGIHKFLGLKKYSFDEAVKEHLRDIGKNTTALKLASALSDPLSSGDPSSAPNTSYTIGSPAVSVSCPTAPPCLQAGYLALLVNTLDVGGLEQVVAHLARGFADSGITIQIWCLYSGGNVADSLSKEGFPILCFGGNTKKLYQYAKNNPPLLINSHYIELDLSAFHSLNIPVVEVIHNMYVVQPVPFLQREKIKYQFCTNVVAVSHIVKQIYLNKIEESDSNHKVIVIENAAQAKDTSPSDRKKLRQELRINEDSFVFLNVGSIDARKNQLSLVDAFDIITTGLTSENIYLLLIGNVLDEEYQKKLKQKIEHCAHKTQILLLPYSDRIQDFYQGADAFLMNSYYEGWSIAATEALYAGLPLIHSECGSARELICNGRFGFMVPNPLPQITQLNPEELLHSMSSGIYCNLEELVRAMLQLLAEKEFWKKQREIIRHESRNLFHENAIIEKYLKLFSQIINR